MKIKCIFDKTTFVALLLFISFLGYSCSNIKSSNNTNGTSNNVIINNHQNNTSNNQNNNNKEKEFREVLDTEGNIVKVPKNIKNIAAMSPAVTDIILELGFYDEITLVDYYSYQVGRSIATNDNIVKTDMLNPNIEAIVESGCDIVFISDINYIQDRFEMLKEIGITVINVPANNRLHEIGKSIEFVGRVLDREELAISIARNLNSELGKIQRMSAQVPENNKQRIFFEMEPPPNIYTFGRGVFIDDIINLIGAENAFKDQRGWIKVSEEGVIASNPDIIIAFERHGSATISTNIATRAGWQHIAAVRNNRILHMNNDGILSRPTQSIIKPIKQIAKYVYPEVYKDLE